MTPLIFATRSKMPTHIFVASVSPAISKEVSSILLVLVGSCLRYNHCLQEVPAQAVKEIWNVPGDPYCVRKLLCVPVSGLPPEADQVMLSTFPEYRNAHSTFFPVWAVDGHWRVISGAFPASPFVIRLTCLSPITFHDCNACICNRTAILIASF